MKNTEEDGHFRSLFACHLFLSHFPHLSELSFNPSFLTFSSLFLAFFLSDTQSEEKDDDSRQEHDWILKASSPFF